MLLLLNSFNCASISVFRFPVVFVFLVVVELNSLYYSFRSDFLSCSYSSARVPTVCNVAYCSTMFLCVFLLIDVLCLIVHNLFTIVIVLSIVDEILLSRLVCRAERRQPKNARRPTSLLRYYLILFIA